MKKHLDAATKLGRRQGATLGEGSRPSSQARGRKDGEASGRLRANALAKITDEYRGAQASSEIGGDHNALK